MLTFACLKTHAASGGFAMLHDAIQRTWSEMRSPELGRHALERRLLETAGASSGRINTGSDVAQLAARLLDEKVAPSSDPAHAGASLVGQARGT